MTIQPEPSPTLSFRVLGVLLFLFFTTLVRADTEYYRHVLFDNSLESDAYFYSEGKASAPSTLELNRNKLPVSREVFFTPPNALRLKWRSVAGGGWEAAVRAIDFRNRQIAFRGDTLYFWCYSEEGIAGQNLPAIRLQDTGKNFSGSPGSRQIYDGYSGEKWVQVRVPLNEFKTGSIHAFEPGQTERMFSAKTRPTETSTSCSSTKSQSMMLLPSARRL